MTGLGLKREHAARSAHRLGVHVLGLSGTPKGSGQLTPCQRIDQGETEVCHSCSAAACCWVACNEAGKPLGFVPSQVEIASCTYADLRAAATPVGAKLPPLSDDGAQLTDVAEAMKRWGIKPMGAPVDGRFCDVPDDGPGIAFPEPSVADLHAAANHPISGEYQIPVDADAPRLVALCIDAGIPVWLGTFVDTAFEQLTSGNVAQPPNEADPNGGGHAMYISGYRTAADGSFEFRVENSWGSTWCEGGACWASSAWLRACWNLWPFSVTS